MEKQIGRLKREKSSVMYQESTKSKNQLIGDWKSSSFVSERSVVSWLKSDRIINKSDSASLNPVEISILENSVGRLSDEDRSKYQLACKITWYIGIFLLLAIAILCLVPSALYYVLDPISEKIIKIYGIVGSSSLAVITFFIVFFDCCYDSQLIDYEEEVILFTKQEEAIRRKNEKKLRKLENSMKKSDNLTFVPKSQKSVRMMPEKNDSHPTIFPTDTTLTHPNVHRHIQYVHGHSHITHHDQFVCDICHASHTKNNNEYSVINIGVDTSDTFGPISKRKKTLIKVSAETQTLPPQSNISIETQTARDEGTQTRNGMPSDIPENIKEIVVHRTIFKAPRQLLPTLKRSFMEQEEKIGLSEEISITNTNLTEN